MSIYIPHWLVLWLTCAAIVAASMYSTVLVFDSLNWITNRVCSVVGVHAELIWFVQHRKHVHEMWKRRNEKEGM